MGKCEGETEELHRQGYFRIVQKRKFEQDRVRRVLVSILLQLRFTHGVLQD